MEVLTIFFSRQIEGCCSVKSKRSTKCLSFTMNFRKRFENENYLRANAKCAESFRIAFLALLSTPVFIATMW